MSKNESNKQIDQDKEITRNILVIKVGGAFMQGEDAALALLTTIGKLQKSYIVVLVHGGGAMVEELLSALS